jgi:hypothetical protein
MSLDNLPSLQPRRNRPKAAQVTVRKINPFEAAANSLQPLLERYHVKLLWLRLTIRYIRRQTQCLSTNLSHHPPARLQAGPTHNAAIAFAVYAAFAPITRHSCAVNRPSFAALFALSNRFHRFKPTSKTGRALPRFWFIQAWVRTL